MLNARDVSVVSGRSAILDGLDFTAHPGRVTAIVGPSGAGKSTLLKSVAGELPFTGEIVLNGLSVGTARPTSLAEIRAVLPQATHLAFPFTVAEVVRLGLLGDPADSPIVGQALDRVGLSGFGARFYQELSGGEQQRVQLARVLAQVWVPVAPVGPRWLLLDEPVSNLDIGHQLQIMQIARSFANRGGGVVAVMHDLNLTAMFADSVILMSAGRILAQDRPDRVLNDELLSQVYNCRIAVNKTPADGVFVLPQLAAHPFGGSAGWLNDR